MDEQIESEKIRFQGSMKESSITRRPLMKALGAITASSFSTEQALASRGGTNNTVSSIGTVKDDEKENLVRIAKESPEYDELSSVIERQYNLSMSGSDTIAYSDSKSKNHPINVISFFPRYELQSEPANGINIAIEIEDEEVTAAEGVIINYQRNIPGRIYILVADGDTVTRRRRQLNIAYLFDERLGESPIIQPAINSVKSQYGVLQELGPDVGIAVVSILSRRYSEVGVRQRMIAAAIIGYFVQEFGRGADVKKVSNEVGP